MSIEQAIAERGRAIPHWRKRGKKVIARQVELGFVGEAFRLVGETAPAARVEPARAAELFTEMFETLA